MKRKEYWNRSYLEYWKQRVAESDPHGGESTVIAGDVKTEDDTVYEAVFAKYPLRKGKVLDVGCAWGRMFPFWKKFELCITGVDISGAMIEEARKNYGHDSAVECLLECEAEQLPFPDGAFDNVACLAVFDATYQHRALKEFLRVLHTAGLLYLTGKNDTYEKTDDKAIQAEEGARRKGHPNYFTETRHMLSFIKTQGHRLVASYFFPRRGDFGKRHFITTMPEEFYEYFVVIEKSGPVASFPPFSKSISRTFRDTHKTPSHHLL